MGESVLIFLSLTDFTGRNDLQCYPFSCQCHDFMFLKKKRNDFVYTEYVYPFIHLLKDLCLSSFLSCCDQYSHKHECANISMVCCQLFMICVNLITFLLMSCHPKVFPAAVPPELKHSFTRFQSAPLSLWFTTASICGEYAQLPCFPALHDVGRIFLSHHLVPSSHSEA